MKKTTQFEVIPVEEVLRIAVPIGEDEPAEDPSDQNNEPAPQSQNKHSDEPDEQGHAMARKIFVVDDEGVIADSLTAILNRSGYDARAFYDGGAVLSACETTIPECVISDVVMPGISGIELAVRIRERSPGCRILLFSGQAATSNLLEAAHRSGHDFEVLLKPVHPRDLLARLAMENQCPPPDYSSSTLQTL